MELPFESFSEFLGWLFGPSMGGLVILMWFASWALEDVAWWHNLTPKTRSIIFYLSSIVIGIGAYLLLQNEAVVQAIEPYFRIVLAATVVWLSTQVAHKVDKATSSYYEIVDEDECSESPLG